MRIMITKSGIYRNTNDIIPVGTELEVPDDFSKWGGKWEPVEETKGKTLEVASPASDEDDELTTARTEYEQQFGERPHPRMKADTIRARLADKE